MPPAPALPVELLLDIWSYVMEDDFPLHLDYFFNRAHHRYRNNLYIPKHTALLKWLDRKQHPHRQDFLLANSISRSWRTTGKRAFFTHKTFVISVSMLVKLQNCEVPGFSAAEALKWVSQVIVPIPDILETSVMASLPAYHAFENLKRLELQPGVKSTDIVDVFSYCQPWGNGTCWFSKTKFFLRPEVLQVLEGIGLSVRELKVRWLFTSTEEARLYVKSFLGGGRLARVKEFDKAREFDHKPPGSPKKRISRTRD